jgi:hypothetical protein
MNLEDIGFDGVEWMYLAQDKDQWSAFVNTVMSLLIP